MSVESWEQATVSSSVKLSKRARETMSTNSQAGPVARRSGSERSERRTGWDFVALGVAVIVGLAACVAFLPVLENRFVDQWDG
jgi:hypothetical protein